MLCPKCNKKFREGAKFCTRCGTKIPKMTVCPNCGKPMPSVFAFCQNCGASINAKLADEKPVKEQHMEKSPMEENPPQKENPPQEENPPLEENDAAAFKQKENLVGKVILLCGIIIFLILIVATCSGVDLTPNATESMAVSAARDALKEEYEGNFSVIIEENGDNNFLATASKSRSGDLFSYTQKISFNLYYNSGNWSHSEFSENLDVTLNENITYYKNHIMGKSHATVFGITAIWGTSASIRSYTYNSWDGEFFGEEYKSVSLSRVFDEEDGLCFYFSFDGYGQGRYKLTCDDLYYNSAVDPSYGMYRYCSPVNIESFWWYEDIKK